MSAYFKAIPEIQV